MKQEKEKELELDKEAIGFAIPFAIVSLCTSLQFRYTVCYNFAILFVINFLNK